MTYRPEVDGRWCPGCEALVKEQHWVDSMRVLMKLCMIAARQHECLMAECGCRRSMPYSAAVVRVPIHD